MPKLKQFYFGIILFGTSFAVQWYFFGTSYAVQRYCFGVHCGFHYSTVEIISSEFYHCDCCDHYHHLFNIIISVKN